MSSAVPKHCGTHSRDLFGRAAAENARHAERRAEDRERDARVAPRQLLGHHRERDAGRVAERVGDEVHRVQADLGGLLDDRPRRLFALVPFGRGRTDHVGGEVCTHSWIWSWSSLSSSEKVDIGSSGRAAVLRHRSVRSAASGADPSRIGRRDRSPTGGAGSPGRKSVTPPPDRLRRDRRRAGSVASGARGRHSGARAAIVGIGETDYVRGADPSPGRADARSRRPRRSPTPGLTIADIDGIIPPPGYTTSEELAANLGIEDLHLATTVHMGGASPTASLQHASARGARGHRPQRARGGRLERLLRVPAARGCAATAARPRRRRGRRRAPRLLPARTARASAAQFYAWIATRYQQLFGILPTDTGAIAVAFRKHAQLNEKALMRGTPLTMDDYLASPWVSEPFRTARLLRRDRLRGGRRS